MTILHVCIVLVTSVCIGECFKKVAFLDFDHTCIGSTNVENTTVVIRFPNNSGFNCVDSNFVLSKFHTSLAVMCTFGYDVKTKRDVS